MSFDPKCCDLARSFLQDKIDIPTAIATASLAQWIQDSIEEWLDTQWADYATLREGTSKESAP